eukprot:TRINITY_DN39007_c0_g1_i1.p1 TRINITY_DN39007_c0_g1~~TRINITY_DN39007_c0_g1_i1.p1  ORF type:complete len:682 (+),score=73.54 TRINITY_DN39007_c0_g1_i1:191-2047(+)
MDQVFKCNTRVAQRIRSESFEGAMGMLIIANCVMLGIEADVFIGNIEGPVWLRYTDHLFTVLFNVEIVLRLHAFGWRAMFFGRDKSLNIFDVGVILMTNAVWLFSSRVDDDSIAALISSFTALRTVRLIRLGRVVKKVPLFREVSLLVRGLVQSFRVLFWTILVVFVITYVFAIFGVLLVSADVKKGLAGTIPAPSLTTQELEMLWNATGGVLTWMFTLIQVLTLDSWTSIVRPLMLVSPWCWVLFYMYVALAVVVLLNLVTAIIVENAFKCANLDEEERAMEIQKVHLEAFQRLQNLFKCLDTDASGDVSWDEFEASFKKPEVRNEMIKLDIEEAELKNLFELMDTGDGVLSLEEFFIGMKRATGTATAKESYHISRRVDYLCQLAERNNAVMESLMTGCSDQNLGGESVRLSPERSGFGRLFSSVSTTSKKLGQRKTRKQATTTVPYRDQSPNVGLFRGPFDELAGKIDDIAEEFRHQSRTMHCQVTKCFESIYNTFGPESKIFSGIADVSSVSCRAEQVDCLTPGEPFLLVNTKAMAERFEMRGNSRHQTGSENAVVTPRTPVLPRHTRAHEVFESVDIDEAVPKPVAALTPRSANEGISSAAHSVSRDCECPRV